MTFSGFWMVWPHWVSEAGRKIAPGRAFASTWKVKLTKNAWLCANLTVAALVSENNMFFLCELDFTAMRRLFCRCKCEKCKSKHLQVSVSTLTEHHNIQEKITCCAHHMWNRMRHVMQNSKVKSNTNVLASSTSVKSFNYMCASQQKMYGLFPHNGWPVSTV